MNIKLFASILAASSVISLTYIQSLAADYSDVSQSDSYYQAVNNLSNLNVINGYDDGTFKPDREVSRAEITKMIFSAFRPNATAEVNAAKGHDTQFKDVPGTHWASGYISVGTKSELGFINGYSSSSFGPEDTVTYSQAIKMLVSALGYNSEAEKNGGWPSGYLKQGSSLGLSLPNVSNSQPLNRAQVAVLLDMAIKINNGESANTNSQNDIKKDTSENILKLEPGAPKQYGRQYHITEETAIKLIQQRYNDTSSLSLVGTTAFTFESPYCYYRVERFYNSDDIDEVPVEISPKGKGLKDYYNYVYVEKRICKKCGNEYMLKLSEQEYAKFQGGERFSCPKCGDINSKFLIIKDKDTTVHSVWASDNWD